MGSIRFLRVMPFVLVAALASPASAGAAAWDTSPLALAPADARPGTLAVTTTADGASWGIWTENPDSDSDSDVVVRRVSATGLPGQRRVLTTDGVEFDSISLAALSPTDVRVAYVTGPGGGTAIHTRQLGPAETGQAETLYDKDTSDDGNISDNGAVGAYVAVHAAPAGAAWVAWGRVNAGGPAVEARYVGASGAIAPLVELASGVGISTATTPSGALVAAYTRGPQGQVLASRVATAAGAPEDPIVLRPSSPPEPPSVLIHTTELAIDHAGVATAAWSGARNTTDTDLESFAEARRFDATATPMTTQGGVPAALSGGGPPGYDHSTPLLGADPDGDVLATWYEHALVSPPEATEAIVRELGAGALPGAIGPRLQLDGPAEAAFPRAVVPESVAQTRVVFQADAYGPAGVSSCRAARIGEGGVLLGTDDIATGCWDPVAPPTAANGLSVLFTTPGGAREVRLSRWVESAPVCSDGAPVAVEAGRSITLTLACDGWRPVRQVTGAASPLGALGAVDQSTGEVTFTAGAKPGTGEVRYRAVNAAGAGAERKLTVTVTPAPLTPDRTAPVISAARVTPKRISAGSRGGPLLSFRLSEAATVKIRVQVRAHGRRSGGKCRTAAKLQRELRRKPGCQAWRIVAGTKKRAPAGISTLRLRGSKGRPLPRGAYRVLVTATDAAGNRSREARPVFEVTR